MWFPRAPGKRSRNFSTDVLFRAILSGMTSRLADKWVIITGASSGFGAAAARAFGAEGARLLIGARRLDRLEIVAAEARQSGSPEVCFHALDVSETSSVEAFVNWAREQIVRRQQVPTPEKSSAAPPGIDVLINNAGGAQGLDTVAEGKDADWETMMQTNVLGVLRMTRAVLPLMLNRPGGSILNMWLDCRPHGL